MKKLYILTKAGGFLDFVDVNEIALIQPDGLNKFTTVHFKSGLSVIYTSESVLKLIELAPIEVYNFKEEEVDA